MQGTHRTHRRLCQSELNTLLSHKLCSFNTMLSEKLCVYHVVTRALWTRIHFAFSHPITSEISSCNNLVPHVQEFGCLQILYMLFSLWTVSRSQSRAVIRWCMHACKCKAGEEVSVFWPSGMTVTVTWLCKSCLLAIWITLDVFPHPLSMCNCPGPWGNWSARASSLLCSYVNTELGIVELLCFDLWTALGCWVKEGWDELFIFLRDMLLK